MQRMGWALRTLLVSDSSSCLKDRKVAGKFIRKCGPGTELVEWLMNLSPIVHTRVQAAGMWQALLEEGVLSHGKRSDILLETKHQSTLFALFSSRPRTTLQRQVLFVPFQMRWRRLGHIAPIGRHQFSQRTCTRSTHRPTPSRTWRNTANDPEKTVSVLLYKEKTLLIIQINFLSSSTQHPGENDVKIFLRIIYIFKFPVSCLIKRITVWLGRVLRRCSFCFS
jgi:Domain found in Dishevelled, Egl-10, and Pleckstrin (DEP)